MEDTFKVFGCSLLKILSLIIIVLAFLFIIGNPHEQKVIVLMVVIGALSIFLYKRSSDRLKQDTTSKRINRIEKTPMMRFLFWIMWVVSIPMVVFGAFWFVIWAMFLRRGCEPDCVLIFLPLIVACSGIFLFWWARRKLKRVKTSL